MHGNSNTHSSEVVTKKNSFLLSLFAFAATLIFIAAGITHFLMPPEQIHFAHGIMATFFHPREQIPLHFTFITGHLPSVYCSVSVCLWFCPERKSRYFFFRIAHTWTVIGLVLTGIFIFFLSYRWFRAGFFVNLAAGVGGIKGVLKETGLPHNMELSEIFWSNSFAIVLAIKTKK